jgi:phytoene dehydrogenase-like protein
MRDVVVVGGGHNGLVAACYLAAAGLDVEVVERDTVPGGAVSTVERFPGYRVDRGSSLHVMVRHTGVIDELDLGAVGLRYVDADPWAWAPLPGGRSVTFHVDLDRTCASIAQACGAREADAYRGFVTTWLPRARRLFALFAEAPTARALGRYGLAVSGGLRGLRGAGELVRQFLVPADQLLDSWFADEDLKAVLAWLAAQAGPPAHEPGSAPLLGWNALLHERPPGRPVGGSGALAEALVQRLEKSGGSLRLGDEAVRLTRGASGVDGVVTASGERVAARAVVAACHVLTTYRLLDDPALLADATRRIRVSAGMGMVIRLGTTELPAYPGAAPESQHGMVLLGGSRGALRLAYGEAGAGLLPSRPAALVMAHTALDPTLAPPGRHSLTVWGQWHPYRLSGGRSWDEARVEAGQGLLDVVERAAPGFRDSVEQVHVQTPLDLERELALPQGDVMHLPMSLESMFGFRPLPEVSRYRGPVPGLYLAGASTHPGGGVSGASGRSAARVVLADLRRRHKPTR